MTLEQFTAVAFHPFTLGLLLGLLIAAFIWKSGFSAKRNLSRELKRVEGEMKNLQEHLNTQLKITASGNQTLQAELESLKKQNETLRVNNAGLQTKPGRAEMRQLQIQENAIRAMREQAPGFAPAWEKALRQAESEVQASESGFVKQLVQKVIPGFGGATPALTVTDETSDRS